MGNDMPLPEDSEKMEIISSGSGGPLRPTQETDSLRGVGKFIGFALLFNLLLWLFALFAQIRGWVDVTASYFILLAMWFVGTLICLALGAQLRLQRKRLAVTLGSVVWAGALIGLNAVAPKPIKVTAIGTASSQSGTSETVPSDLLSPLTVSAAKLIFKDQQIGTTSDPQTVTVVNRGNMPQTISPRVVGDFSQTNDCGSELIAGGSCDIAITFTPTKSGFAYGSLEIPSSSPFGGAPANPATVALRASATRRKTILSEGNPTIVGTGDKPPGQSKVTHEPRVIVSEFNLYLPSQTQNGVLLARVHYGNAGTAPITAHTYGSTMRSEPRQLTLDEQREGIRLAREAADKGNVSESELYPNDMHNFVDMPDSTFFTSTSHREQSFFEGTYYVYVFVVLKYRDSETTRGTIGITEWCAWLTRTTTFYHECLIPNKTHVESGHLR